MLPDTFARFLFEFHSGRFESLDLPILPDDRSQFDVHCTLQHDRVKQLRGFVMGRKTGLEAGRAGPRSLFSVTVAAE